IAVRASALMFRSIFSSRSLPPKAWAKAVDWGWPFLRTSFDATAVTSAWKASREMAPLSPSHCLSGQRPGPMQPDISYQMTFADGRQERIVLALDPQSGEIICDEDYIPPVWAMLGHHQCRHCPLRQD